MSNRNIAAVRDMNASDPLPGLGELKPRAEPAAPKPVDLGNGIIIGIDGKRSTNLPDPTVEPPTPPSPVTIGVDFGSGDATVYVYHHPPEPIKYTSAAPTEAEPGANGLIKAGDWVRLIGDSWLQEWRCRVMQITDIIDAAIHVGRGNEELTLWGWKEGDDWERCAPPVLKTADYVGKKVRIVDGDAAGLPQSFNGLMSLCGFLARDVFYSR